MIGRTHNLKSSRLVARRRRAVVGRSLLAIICFVSIWSTAFFASSFEPVVINDVQVVGESSISVTEIKNTVSTFLDGRYFFTISHANILFYPKQTIKSNILEKFPSVDSVEISFKNFHTIEVKISERRGIALWCHNEKKELSKIVLEKCFVMDGDSLIFAPAPDVASSSPPFIKFYSALPKDKPIRQEYTSSVHFKSIINFAKGLKSLGFAVVYFNERNDYDFDAKLSTGTRLIFGKSSDLEAVLNNFKTVVFDSRFSGGGDTSTIDYVDLRYGNKVYYKAK